MKSIVIFVNQINKTKMKNQITASELTEIAKHFPPMSANQLESMVERNGVTLTKLEALKASIERSASK